MGFKFIWPIKRRRGRSHVNFLVIHAKPSLSLYPTLRLYPLRRLSLVRSKFNLTFMSQEKRDNKPLTGHKTNGGSEGGKRRVPSAAFEPFKYANVAWQGTLTPSRCSSVSNFCTLICMFSTARHCLHLPRRAMAGAERVLEPELCWCGT